MRSTRPLLSLLAAAGLAACAPPPRCPEVAAPAAPPAAESKPAPAAPSGPRLSIALHPRPREARVDVTLRAAAPPEALTSFSLSGEPATVHLTRVADARGAMDVKLGDKPGRVTLTLPRAAEGELEIAYSVDGKPRSFTAPPGVDPDGNHFQSVGEPLLLLPDALDDREIHATISIDPEAYVVDDGGRSRVEVASSFGVGDRREVSLRGAELRRGVYLAGNMGRARFDASEGRDEAAWLGYTAFDPRPIAADVAAFRTAVRELFKSGDDVPETLLILPDERPPGTFVATRRARGVVVRVGAGEAWTGAVRIAVATEILHAWIGERLWIGPDDAAHEAEAYWFSEGVARFLARDLLFRFGLITTRELLDEVHGLLALSATSPLAAEGNAALAARAKQPGAVPLLVARGAVYATRVHALLRARGDKSGKGNKADRSLADVLRALYQKARTARGPLPTSAWIEAVTAEIGAGEAEAFRRNIDRGKLDDLPEDALGPCFRRAPRTYEPYDLGFDEGVVIGAPITGLRPGGPAERAGVRAGDVLNDKIATRGRSDVEVTLEVKRGDAVKKIRYLPAGPKARGTGFVRRTDVAEEACTR